MCCVGAMMGFLKNVFVVVERRDRATLIPIIEKEILPGTTIMRIRNNSYPTISSKEFVLEGKWTMTVEPNQQKFLFYDNRSINNRIIIFASPDCLEILSQNDHVFMEGTFSSCPKGFYQLYISFNLLKSKISASKEDSLIEMSYDQTLKSYFKSTQLTPF
ncbi:hypothetical protein QTP88_021445 [Uroleucon formosanum]